MPNSHPDHDRMNVSVDSARADYKRLLEPEAWGDPLSYVDLLVDPTVQTRIAKLIVQSTLKRPHRRGDRGRRF